ncbi:MAG: DUF1926 protein [Dehalococcoidia bacterium]|nr:DUF1926 protein [Dehalococcoidia bacterium]
MKQIYLSLALHNHQPVGNFPSVFQQAYEMAYLPLVQLLETHPAIRLSLHYTGPLWDWLIDNHSDFLTRLASLRSRGQVELMTGGYYEPILPAIPDADKEGQISRMNTFIKERFSVHPTGLWLAERVWEPYLAKPLAEAGIEWTLVDDTHFKMVGLEEKELLGYYITEEQGYSLKIFPSLKRLRYFIPWREVSEVIALLKELADESGTKIAVMGDDGEKFGVWPQTFEHCWQKGWMESFFSALEENSQWLHLIPLGEFARQFPPVGRVYLPCASYDEMLEWALPAGKSYHFTNLKHRLEADGRQDVLDYLKGGFWRHFLVKYPEANWMHKRMLWAHQKVYRAIAKKQRDAAQPSFDCGQSELWQAQCNCPYWHGVFGGLYLADIRAANFRHLVKAEYQANQMLHGPHPWLHWEMADMDFDGHPEVVIETENQALWFKPSHGGSLVEWDLRIPGYNLLSTLARRPEAYHLMMQEKLSSKGNDGNAAIKNIHDGLRQRTELPPVFSYDKYPRVSFIEHILPLDITLDDFTSGQYQEAETWASLAYEKDLKPDGQSLVLNLKREGQLYDKTALRLEKALKVTLDGNSLGGFEVTYTLTNTGTNPSSGLFGSEWNFNLLGGGHNPQAYYKLGNGKTDRLDTTFQEDSIAEVYLGNRYLNIELGLNTNPPARLWWFPVETISNSEAGLEKTYQASCLLLLYPFSLQPGANLSIKLNWSACPTPLQI